jgi:hypothetical protein
MFTLREDAFVGITKSVKLLVTGVVREYVVVVGNKVDVVVVDCESLLFAESCARTATTLSSNAARQLTPRRIGVIFVIRKLTSVTELASPLLHVSCSGKTSMVIIQPVEFLQ